jgi:hypothetical protein
VDSRNFEKNPLKTPTSAMVGLSGSRVLQCPTRAFRLVKRRASIARSSGMYKPYSADGRVGGIILVYTSFY